MIKFSLIVPAYQVENFIKRCLDSCFSQDLSSDEYEVLVINDGSKDKSLEIAQEYLSSHNNIHIFSQENKGLSEARNTGIRNAKGKYVWFIDSDDWINNNCLAEMYNLCEKNDLDILHFRATDFKNDQGVVREEDVTFYNQILSGKDYILNSSFIGFPVWLNIFKRSFLAENQLFFKAGIYHEDNEFSPRAFYYAKTVLFVEKSYYNVYHNPQSITRTANSKKSFDLLQVMEATSLFLKENVTEDKIKIKFYNYIGLAFNGAFDNILTASLEDRRLFISEIKKNQKLVNEISKSEILKYRIQIFIFNMSMPLYLHVFSILKNKKLIKW
ncbi:glycosyltransferase [Chryseobacterium sp. G0186]|uniref:glycosyltransferase n=1 Tax=Chryseobacterium sp. G0186 TaxID=2487064 RepID=UPI000F51684F|nr:glycosyltransferase [Chryseobacterium sp. G0186]AZA77675.1 glycosyltransferase [Chryseobacterium sp. G0186]